MRLAPSLNRLLLVFVWEYAQIMYGRHFDHKNPIYARMTRQAIDTLKAEFRDDLSKEEWLCVRKLKGILGVE